MKAFEDKREGVKCLRYPAKIVVLMVEEGIALNNKRPLFINVLPDILPHPLACGEWQKGSTCVDLPSIPSTESNNKASSRIKLQKV